MYIYILFIYKYYLYIYILYIIIYILFIYIYILLIYIYIYIEHIYENSLMIESSILKILGKTTKQSYFRLLDAMICV